jgi:CheY-like chemotaxis protein
LVRVGRHEIALPASAVAGVYDAHALRTSCDTAGAFVEIEGVRVPILHLAFHLGDVGFDEMLREHVVVVGSCERRAALFAAGDRRGGSGRLIGEANGLWAGGLETEFGTFPMLHVGNLLGRSATTAATVEARPAVRQPEPDAARPRTVLIVDSSEIEREHLSTVIAETGHTVLAAQSASEAWGLLESRPVDLVVCDLRLPEMNAQQLSERRRVAGRFKQIPVLLILSHAGEQSHLVVQQLGAAAWVRSPLQREDVLAAVTRLVRA